jgi:uncharacterized protein (DUF1501 family)
MAMQRRDFIKALASIGGMGALGAAGQLALPRYAAAAAPEFSDYKALVCIFLYGGNDAFNMLVPIGDDPNKGYSPYARTRGRLAVKDVDLDLGRVTTNNNNLNNGVLGTGRENPYNHNHNHATAYLKGHYPLSSKGINLGVNAVMPELAQLFMDNRVMILGNTGTLVEPVTKNMIRDGEAALPLFLFAHNHQQRELQTGQANNLNDIGWAGKIADAWNDVNQSNPLGLNFSYAGNDHFMIGHTSTPITFKAGSPPEISYLIGEQEMRRERYALFSALAGVQGSTDQLSFDASNTVTTNDPFKDLYNRKLRNSVSTFEELNKNWHSVEMNYTSTGPYGEELFEVPSQQQLGFSNSIDGQLIRQLESVAKMIHLGASGHLGSNYNRQIFFVRLTGFDNHSYQAPDHPRLLRELSLSLWKFQKAMEELGHADKVTSFTMSDFGRTLTYNGDGTDHGWGSHQLVMGGYGSGNPNTLDGGKLQGVLPDLTISGDDDYSDKGRLIPKLAQDQVNAALVDWFGADQSMIRTLFPNLSNFQTTDELTSAYAHLFV